MRTDVCALVFLLAVGCGGEEPATRGGAATERERSEAETRRAAFFRTLRRAAAANRSGDKEGAVRLWREALETNPEHEGCLVDLARTLRELGRPSEALEVLERLRAVRSDLPRPHFLIAEVLSESEGATEADLERARDLYTRALEIEPNVSGPRLGLARVERRLGRRAEAEVAYRTVLGTNPDSQEALTGLAEILLETERAAAAVPLLVRALEVGTRASGRRDVPSEMDTKQSFDAASLDAPANRRALEALTRAAKAVGGYPPGVPSRFRAR